jgi:hypothetical protein
MRKFKKKRHKCNGCDFSSDHITVVLAHKKFHKS